MLGCAFMGTAHANGYRTLGFERFVTDWKELVADPEVELIDNSGPNNLHGEPTIAAAEAGKHVIRGKPLAREAQESCELWQRVQAAGVVHVFFVHELEHLLGAIAGQSPVAPHGATFEDGYRAEVCEAIVRSAECGRRESIRDRTATAA
jgi:hypothetical protein